MFINRKISCVPDKLRTLYEKRFFHIFGSNVFSLFLSFLTSVIVVRQLDKAAYGTYAIANNIYSYFALFIGIGFINGIMQYCSEQREEKEKKAIFSFTFFTGTIVNILICAAICVSSLANIDSDTDVNKLLFAMCGIPIVSYAAEYFKSYARIKKYNSMYSYINICGATAHFIVVIIATKYFSVYGYILSTYFQHIVIVLIYLVIMKKKKNTVVSVKNNRLSAKLKTDIVKYSLLCCITNLTSTLLSLLDITCLNRILNNAESIASYKVALTFPNALMFIPASFLVFIYPYLAENNNNAVALKKYVDKSLIFLVAANGIVCLVLFIGADIVVNLLWGNRFIDAVPVFRILIVNYFVGGTFRKLYGNVITAIRKVKINLINTALAGILNIILNVVLIVNFGSIGAAYATLIVTIITSGIAYFYYICWHKKQIKNKIIPEV